MSGITYLVGVVIPYIAFVIFVIGFVLRVINWAKSPVPFKIPTTCGQQKSLPWIKSSYFENPYTLGGVIGRMIGEVVFFRSLFRNLSFNLIKEKPALVYRETKWLWLGAIAFHWCLFVTLFRHLRFFLQPVPGIVEKVCYLDSLVGQAILIVPEFFVTGVVIVVALLFLLLRRLWSPQLRYISLPSDYFALLLLLAITISGNLLRYFCRTDVTKIKELAIGLVTFHPVIPEGIHWMFYVHLFCVSVLIAYIPFSKIMHMAGIFLSPTRNMRNDSRMRRHINPWITPAKFHTYEEWEREFKDQLKEVGIPLEYVKEEGESS